MCEKKLLELKSCCNNGSFGYINGSIGEESTLVQENIELCEKKLLELKSCNDGSIGYINGSLKIKPYFKNNAELCI